MYLNDVTLHARVWIETRTVADLKVDAPVTLHARVWIETLWQDWTDFIGRSPSTRGCGLKPKRCLNSI